jgi:hypothetical protein|tara:strand:+ start:29893 stop:30084 length:192 start_codon:yes stop_codon:yes gene_type:complete
MSDLDLIEKAYAENDVAYLIEIREIYDGWSILVRQSDGARLNRWEPGTKRFILTQEYIKETTK